MPTNTDWYRLVQNWYRTGTVSTVFSICYSTVDSREMKSLYFLTISGSVGTSGFLRDGRNYQKIITNSCQLFGRFVAYIYEGVKRYNVINVLNV